LVQVLQELWHYTSTTMIMTTITQTKR